MGEELRQNDDMLRVLRDMLRHRLRYGRLLVQALWHRHHCKVGEIVRLENLLPHAGELGGHLDKNALPLSSDRQHGKDGSQAKHHKEGALRHGGYGFPVEALALGIVKTAVVDLPKGLRQLVDIVTRALLLLLGCIEQLADGQKAIGAPTATGIPDEEVRHGRLLACWGGFSEVLHTIVRLWRRPAPPGRSLLQSLVVGVHDVFPLGIVERSRPLIRRKLHRRRRRSLRPWLRLHFCLLPCCCCAGGRQCRLGGQGPRHRLAEALTQKPSGKLRLRRREHGLALRRALRRLRQEEVRPSLRPRGQIDPFAVRQRVPPIPLCDEGRARRSVEALENGPATHNRHPRCTLCRALRICEALQGVEGEARHMLRPLLRPRHSGDGDPLPGNAPPLADQRFQHRALGVAGGPVPREAKLAKLQRVDGLVLGGDEVLAVEPVASTPADNGVLPVGIEELEHGVAPMRWAPTRLLPPRTGSREP
mmetsp:Transcript_92765/g.198893  ORF Transcript_92765/g.198893 Transcript_92765/m.198893 type:complete len:477 (-) Transcript_92765:1-1431(-)